MAELNLVLSMVLQGLNNLVPLLEKHREMLGPDHEGRNRRGAAMTASWASCSHGSRPP